MHYSSIFVLLLAASCLCAVVEPVLSEYAPDITDPGVVLTSEVLTGSDTKEQITATDIHSLLQQQALVNVSTPETLSIIGIQPGQAYSPNAIQPTAEVLYIIEGSGEVMVDETVLRSTVDDVIFIPTGSRLIITNTGSVPFRFVSAISTQKVSSDRPIGVPMKRSLSSIKPIMFGNESDKTRFSISRILSTNDEPLPLSFDLAVGFLPAGSTIPDHAIESGQTAYILSGNGTTSIGCIAHGIATGDLTYVPPNVIQRFVATEDIRLLLLTEPYYIPARDHQVSSAC